jgi:uncharacterized protein YoxC
MLAAASITIADSEANAQTWSLVILVIGVVISAAGFVIRALLQRADKAEAELEKADKVIETLKDQSTAARHETLVTKLNGISTDIHTVSERVGRVEHRVDKLEVVQRKASGGGN